MSAAAPASSASTIAGVLLAVCTSATSVREFDSDAITATAPTVFIQITICEQSSADHTERYPARRSGVSAVTVASLIGADA